MQVVISRQVWRESSTLSPLLLSISFPLISYFSFSLFRFLLRPLPSLSAIEGRITLVCCESSQRFQALWGSLCQAVGSEVEDQRQWAQIRSGGTDGVCRGQSVVKPSAWWKAPGSVEWASLLGSVGSSYGESGGGKGNERWWMGEEEDGRERVYNQRERKRKSFMLSNTFREWAR